MNRYAIIGPDGFPLDHHFEFLASNNIIYVHILPSGGRRPDGSVYESDYDAGINRFFSNLREKKLEIKRI